MLKQNYSYAHNENGGLIHISSAIHGNFYFCPYCGEQMTPHMGKVRRWHFVHKPNFKNCSYESYLHKIAKSRIREAYLSNSTFMISYDVPVRCEKTYCPFSDDYMCSGTQIREYNLKEFYDTCEEEANYKNFRADLMLSSSSRDIAPILIEVFVKHKSTDNKLSDGVRIIELEIKSEEDIENICSEKIIKGERISNFGYFRDDKPKNIFYNFNREYLISPSLMPNLPIKRVIWIKETGEFRSTYISCAKNLEKEIPQDAHYIISNHSVDFTWAFMEIYKRGIKVRNCLICKYLKRDIFNERLCTLYKKFSLPKCPPTKVAKDCPYFRCISHIQEDMSIPNLKYEVVIRSKT